MIAKILEILKAIFSLLSKAKVVEPLPPPVIEPVVEPVVEKPKVEKTPDEPKVVPEAPKPIAPPKPSEPDWSNPKSKISKYFTVEDATALRSWGVLHMPSDEEKKNILEMAKKMDLVRDYIGEPIIVSAWMRPSKANCPNSKWHGQDYNRFIYETQVWRNLSPEEKAKKSVPNSPHREGKAVDWIVAGKGYVAYCDIVRTKLLPKLEEWQIRMEDMQGKGNWIHCDIRPVVNRRFFKP